MTLASVTGPTGTVYLASNTYDGTTLGALLDPTQNNGNNLPSNQPTPTLHDSTYGASFTYRGNPTSSWQMGTTTNTAYLITGVPYKIQDGDGMTVSVSTDGSTANSLPSVLTPNSNGNLSTSMSYNTSFGLTSVTGPNGANQSVFYDVFNRPNSATSVDGAITYYTYTFAPNTQTATISTTVNNATTTQWKTTTFDGFGRPIRVQTGNNGTAVANVDTQYGACGCSPLGKMTATSMPYAPGATVYWTTYTYDGSGRTLTQTKPDGSVTTTSYAGNAVTVTDPAGRWKTYYSDMAGGLTTVVEPNPGNATNPATYYYLNGAGQITQVSVQRNGIAQNRTFTWTGSDLASSTTPEAGTVSYTYDGNHHVITRTDAKSQQTQYAYDAYERLIQVSHYTATGFNGALQQQTNQQVNYTYDVNPLDPGNYLNSWGRLTEVTFQEQTNNGDSFAYLYSYNQAGRVTANTLIAGNGPNLLTNLQATYAWDNQGRLTNLTYPSGTALAYQYDSMGRLSGITQNGNAIATAGYTAASQLSTLQYGTNAMPFYEARSYNTLMQLTNLTVTGTGSVNMQYNYTAGQNNGRVTSTTDGVLGETVNYTYDMWNRLTNATATNGSWGEAYTFDGFGNLTGKTPTAGSAPALNLPANPATNQPAGASYDANGNPQGNSPPSVPTYVWDVENRLVTTQPVVSQPTYYTYDPWGRRMWKEVPGGLDSNGNPLPTPCEIYFYGATGQKLETYSCINNTDGTFYSTLEGINIYFGGKLLQAKGVWVATDKLGSVRANSNGETFSYFPYGEERTSTADGREKFATYTRDGFGQDYAEQRYYSANMGAFWSPDPGGIRTANTNNPVSWNRYMYALGDPISNFDPTGKIACDAGDDNGCEADAGDTDYCDDNGCPDDGGGGDGDDSDDDDDSDDCASTAATQLAGANTNGICFAGGTDATTPTVALAPTPSTGILAAVGRLITSVPGLFVGGFFTVFQGSMSSCQTLTCQGTMPQPPPIEAGRKGERRRTAKPDKPRKHAYPVDPKDPNTRWWVRDPQDPGKRILKPPGWKPDGGE